MSEQQTQHRTELLEAEIRRLRQIMRTLTSMVIAGDENAVSVALGIDDMLKRDGPQVR